MPGGVEVTFPNGRKQVLRFRKRGEYYILETAIISAARVGGYGVTRALRLLYMKNRETDVVTFSLDKSNKMIGYVHQLADSLDLEELEFYILRLAQECDSLEYALAGVDVS